MAAIWGMISASGKMKISVNSIMSKPYAEKCRLDKISMTGTSDYYMACGVINTTKESEKEVLPIVDDELGICVTCDCILDNRKKLKKELGIETSEVVPDGTLMYQAFCRWGIDCVDHFRGTYSMAVYDYTREVLYLISDHVASRCLYYYRCEDGSVIFSSLIEPIRLIVEDISINENYMKDFLTAPGMMPNILSNETAFDGVYKLNPATYLRIKKDSIEEVRYFSLKDSSTNFDYKTAELTGKNFRRLFEKCVKDAINTNSNVSIAMSSGLDSACVGTVAADHLATKAKKLFSYTYVPVKDIPLSGQNVSDETEDVKKIASMHSNIISEFLNNEGKNCFQDLDKVLDIMEMPVKAYVNIPNLCEIYNRAHENGSKLILVGQNGNSTLSHGYIDDVLCDLYLKNKHITFLKYLNRYCKTVKESRKKALKGCIGYFNFSKKVLTESEKLEESKLDFHLTNRFVNESILENYSLEDRYKEGGIKYFEHIPTVQKEYQEFLGKDSLYTYLGELETKLGLRYGVILRDPTKDIRLLRFCYHMPYYYFAYEGIPRWLVRGNFQDMLPEELLNNWMRYGVQNSDCYYRISRDWKEVYPKLQDMLCDTDISKYLKIEDMEEFLNEIQNGISNKQEYTFDELSFALICNWYIKMCQK